MIDRLKGLIDTIVAAGGAPVLVGGSVRDMVMSGQALPDPSTIKDYDIECYGVTLPQLKDALWDANYLFDEVGEFFSVLKVRVHGVEEPVDLSIPRYERSTGDGHKEFEVMANPNLTFKDAARRRDFTMNSMGFDLQTGELLDPFGGKVDIQLGVIRHVSDQFAEDPLRPLRAARFASRFFGFIDPETLGICGAMSGIASSLPSERVWMELEKVLSECHEISRFFYYLEIMGWLDILFPEVAALRGVEQDSEWHPEGDVFIHTMCALNYWSQNLRTGNKEDDLIVAIAILCHDFGKATTTQFIDGHYRARGHEEAGVELAKSFLHRLRQHDLANEVGPLVANHLAPARPFTAKSIRKLSTKVKRMYLLCLVSKADTAGRPPIDPTESHPSIDKFEQAWREMDIPRGGPKPLVGGKYLIELGMKPGPAFKTVLDEVYEKQLDGIITTVAEARERVNFMVSEWGLN